MHENLWRFLRKVWELKMFDMWLWTDSLCLDQGDTHEVKHQVPRMGEIYSQAAQVMIWLGDDELDEFALSVLQRSEGEIKHAHPDEDDEEENETVTEAFKLATLAADRILRLPYWSRVWIVQEVVLASAVQIMCGNISLPLEEFRKKVSPFRYGRKDYHSRPTVWTLCKMRRTGGKLPLSRILLDFRVCESSRPPDKIFGFFGLIAKNGDGTSPVDYIEVDYAKSRMDLFFDVVFECRAPAPELPDIFDSLRRSLLGGAKEHPTVKALAQYQTRAAATSPRHVELSKVALHVLFAVNHLMWHTKLFHCGSGKIVPDLDSRLEEVKDQSKITPAQNAALVACMLLLEHDRKFDIERSILQKAVKLGLYHAPRGHSPWRCKTHQRGPPKKREITSTREYLDYQCPWIRMWDPKVTQHTHNLVRKLCGRSSRSGCDGSYIVFEAVESNFCLFLVEDESRKGVYREKVYIQMYEN
ncbi:heterokaryon incompatibility protein-domain-containing protein [Cladorrhinum samala]|uniref:Heterokaryon incompatibility protein-domain-containing protein n=1 Tax=Cladorrhinum samala TaxID=585594 RepID=A0AAV9I257_9PEZI|nr:heterokaryon incompatibility protein-domain-containing protein [Cladorrhinum samala]